MTKLLLFNNTKKPNTLMWYLKLYIVFGTKNLIFIILNTKLLFYYENPFAYRLVLNMKVM